MLKKVVDLTSQDFSKGLNTISNILNLTKDQSPNMMDVKVNFDGSIEKRQGSKIQNSTIITNSGATGFNQDSGGTLTSNLIAWWNLDETSGSRFDSIGGHTLSDNGSVGSRSGIRNQAASFTTDNQYLLHTNTSTLATGDINFSMSSWFNLTTTGVRTILSKSDAINPTGGITSDTVIMLHMDGADGSTTFTDSSPSPKSMTAFSNAQIDTAQFKFGGASGLFDGTDDFVFTGDSDSYYFTGDFTIDLQVRFNSVAANCGFVGQNEDASNWWGLMWNTSNNLHFEGEFGGTTTFSMDFAWTPSTNTWYHVALTRSGSSWRAFIDGTQIGITITDSDAFTNINGGLEIARSRESGGTNVIHMNGWIDELRVINGTAIWTGNFTPPSEAYSNLGSNYEYHLFVNSDNFVTFRVSSSGTTFNGQVIATSFGAVSTATWYNVVAWHDTADRIGVSVNLSATTAAYTSGVRSGSAPFVIGAVSNGAGLFMNGGVDATGFWKKVLTAQERSDLYNSGAASVYSVGFNRNPWASFDFGASGTRWLTVSAGTGIFASSNLGVNFTTIATSRTATYQSLERSKNILIATSDAYDTPLYWTGSGGSFMVMLNVSAPLARFSVNFQGFTILLNTSARKRGFFYEDENTHLTGDWSDSFDLPSSADDEITTSFVLRGTLYVSTRYFLYRLTYVGGNPDWSFRKIKDFGFVPRTAKIITIKDVGEVCMGMSWDLKLRLFDGSDDKIISDNIENNNMLCDFSMDAISFAGSGPVISFAVHDDNDQNYKLCVAIGADSNDTTHFINYGGRTQAFFPYSNMKFNTMVMAESANQTFLMAFDRSGYCHMMDSGNLDGGTIPINDVFDSPLLFEKSPSEVSKSQKIDFYLSPTSSGSLKFYDRIDFRSQFKHRKDIVLDDTTNKILIKESINIPQTQGVYQYRLTSSSNTANPWKLNRTDFFLEGLGIGQNE